MHTFNVHALAGSQEVAMGDLVRLAIARIARHSVANAVDELLDLIRLTEEEADAAEVEAGDNLDRLQEARDWVRSLGKRLEAQSRSASQESASQGQLSSQQAQQRQITAADSHASEEAAEVVWAQQFSFQSAFANMMGGREPCSFVKFLQQGAVCMQQALDQRQFNGDFSGFCQPHSPEQLRSLASRAQAAIDAYQSDSTDDSGGGSDDDGADGDSDSSGEGGNADREGGEGDARNQLRQKRRKKDGGGSAVRDSIWFYDEVDQPIPDGPRNEEAVLRTADRLALIEYHKQCKAHMDMQGGGEPAAADAGNAPRRPKMHQPRIWVKDVNHPEGGQWQKRVFIPERAIPEWGMAHLTERKKALLRGLPPSTICRGKGDRGNKIVEQDATFIMRSHLDGEGLGLYANKNLAEGTVLGQYVGKRFEAALLAQHNSDGDIGEHFLSLRVVWANMPLFFTGIDGAVCNEADEEGRLYDLAYYVKNGPGSVANSDIRRLCNTKLVVEYRSYDRERELFVDDEYCPGGASRKQRVSDTNTTV
jgi:hypothetical protein